MSQIDAIQQKYKRKMSRIKLTIILSITVVNIIKIFSTIHLFCNKTSCKHVYSNKAHNEAIHIRALQFSRQFYRYQQDGKLFQLNPPSKKLGVLIMLLKIIRGIIMTGIIDNTF